MAIAASAASWAGVTPDSLWLPVRLLTACPPIGFRPRAGLMMTTMATREGWRATDRDPTQ